MKRTKRIIAFALTLSMLFGGAVFAQDKDKTLIAASDTYTSSVNTNKGYSLAEELCVGSDEEDVKKAYISFNVGTVPSGENVRITLRLTPTKIEYGETEGVVSVWGLSSHNWKQSTLTNSNSPKTASKLTALEILEDSICEIEVTDYVRNNISKEGYISFMISEDTVTGSVFAFASKEAKSGKPELVIDADYVAPAVEETPVPTIEPQKDYNEIFTTGELKHTNTQPMKTEAPYIEYPDMSGIPEDIYVEDFTTVRTNKHMVNYVYGEPEGISKMLKGRNTAQITFSLAVSPTNLNKMLIGSDCQTIYRTTDGGKTCFESATGTAGNGINHLAFYPDDDNIAFAIVTAKDQEIINGAWKNVGIYKSTDSGRTWVHKPTDMISKLNNAKMDIMAFGGKMRNGLRPIYVSGTNGTGVWRSLDLGETWECIYEGSSSLHIEAYDDTVVFSAMTDGLKVSYDRGETWTDKTGSLKGQNLISATIDPADYKHWLCATNDGDSTTFDAILWESMDSGETWEKVADRDDMLVNELVGIRFGPLDNKTNKARLYLSANRNQYVIRYSDDNGRTWNRPYYYDPEGYVQVTGAYWASCMAFSLNYPDVVVTGVSNISVSYDKGSNYYCRAFGRSGARVVEMIVHPDNPSDMMFSHIDIGVMRTLPRNNEEWYPMSYMAPMHSDKIDTIRTVHGLGRDPQNSNRIIFGQGGWSGQHTLYESLDNGFNYNHMDTDNTVDAGQKLFYHPQNPNVIYYGTDRSEDNGKTWETMQYPVKAVAPSNGDIVYYASGGYLYISEDRGENWRLFYDGKIPQIGADKIMLVDYEDPYRIFLGTASYGLYVIENETVYHKSSADGIKASKVANREISIEGISQNPRNPDHVIAGGRTLGVNNEPSPGIYESFDRGQTFRMIELPPPADVYWLEFHPTRPQVFIGTSGGTYVYEYENYDKKRPDCYYTDTEGTFCEDEAKYLADMGIIGEEAENDYGRALELGKDRYVYEGDFLTLMIATTDCVCEHLDVIFEDIDWEHRFWAQVQTGLENGLVLLSDGENGKLNLNFKKLTHGMCAKYLVRLLGINGINTEVRAEEINKFMLNGNDAELAHAQAVLYKHGILTGEDGFEFSPDKEITRGEMTYMFARALRLYK